MLDLRLTLTISQVVQFVLEQQLLHKLVLFISHHLQFVIHGVLIRILFLLHLEVQLEIQVECSFSFSEHPLQILVRSRFKTTQMQLLLHQLQLHQVFIIIRVLRVVHSFAALHHKLLTFQSDQDRLQQQVF